MRTHVAQFALWVVLIALLGGTLRAYAANELLAQAVQGASITELQKHIEEKSAELQQIQAQKESLQKTIETVNKSGDSIKKDIQLYNTNINQLNLSIKANTVNIEKLGYEIDSLSQEIVKIRDTVTAQKATISQLFTELQQRENETLLARLLRSETLSQSVSEIQNISSLNSSLLENIDKLKQLEVDYTNKIDDNKKKKVTKVVQTNNLMNLQQITQEQKLEKQKLLEQTKSVEQYYQQQLEELNKKQGEIDSVIEEIEQKMRASFDPTLLPLKRPGVLGFPVDDVYLTQCYGRTPFAVKTYRTKTHNGMDFGGPIGTPLLAADDGKVIKVGNNDRGTSRWNRYQYGKYVLIQYGDNLSTLYGHLSKYNVKEGDTVARGDVVGYMGNTGYSFGTHVHMTVFWAPSVQFKAVPPAAGVVPVGVTINPLDYLPSIFGMPRAGDSGCPRS